MPTEEQKLELEKVTPPDDVLLEMRKLEKTYGLSEGGLCSEATHRFFYLILTSDQFDNITDVDERCRAALTEVKKKCKSTFGI